MISSQVNTTQAICTGDSKAPGRAAAPALAALRLASGRTPGRGTWKASPPLLQCPGRRPSRRRESQVRLRVRVGVNFKFDPAASNSGVAFTGKFQVTGLLPVPRQAGRTAAVTATRPGARAAGAQWFCDVNRARQSGASDSDSGGCHGFLETVDFAFL
jgi:hypothetical protein